MAFTGKQLREYRVKAGLTQEQLGAAVQKTRGCIAQIEAKNRTIRDIEVLKTVQAILHIPYEVIGFVPIEKIIIVGSSAKISLCDKNSQNHIENT